MAFASWQDSAPARTHVAAAAAAADYQPGAFFKRELPCLLAAIEGSERAFDVIVIDGYVWLQHGKPGLGWHVYQQLQQRPAVIGVAKSHYAGCDVAVPVLRGRSRRPLFVTAVGIDLAVAAANIAAMHGAHRIPTLIKLADRLARTAPAG